MSTSSKYIVKPGSATALKKLPTKETGGLTKEEARRLTQQNLARIAELQEALYAEGKQSLLIVFQAMDGAGKDGSIKTIGGAMNPQGVHVSSFKAPSAEELSHDFLWRVHARAPAKGDVAIFNRSHYEDVLIARVDNLVPEKAWQARYGQINDFEKLLAAGGTRILKFYLHISEDEQLERFGDRLDEPAKNWKVSEADFAVREKWDDYRKAFEEVFLKCSTAEAPWFVIPADNKWFRDLALSQVVLETLEAMAPKAPAAEVDVAAIREKYLSAPPRLKKKFNPGQGG